MPSENETNSGINQVSRFLETGELADCVTFFWSRPAQNAIFDRIPPGLSHKMRVFLEAAFPDGLYQHQTQAVEALLAGLNVLVTTGTSSGKSLCYQLPILDTAIKDFSATSLLLFPTKALAEDQLKKMNALMRSLELPKDTQPPVATYDGDTPKGKRIPIRNSARVLLTNPDMLHVGILPQHTHWERFLRNLRFIVIDETHSYRGVFGSHVANVLRRLKRILNFYESSPQFILTSATLSNAEEFAERLTGEPFELFQNDCSFQEARKYFFINPPLIDENLGLRKGMVDQTLEVASVAASKGAQSILFARTRKTVEITLRRLQEALGRSSLELHGYRSGYLPHERRLIEEGLRSGTIRSVVSTNALEMGIDMGKVDMTFLMGFPGSVSAFYQQTGRAGRRERASISVMVASASPMDQYVIRHGDYIQTGGPENALIDPDNPLILIEHLKCAVFELPFQSGEGYGQLDSENLSAYLNALVLMGLLVQRSDRLFWVSEDYPSANSSLRNISGNPVALRLRNGAENRLIGEVDFQSALRMVHPGAVYMHDGETYLAEDLDLEENTAWLIPHHEGYFTEHRSETKISVENLLLSSSHKCWEKNFADILVKEQVKGYKKIDWETLIPISIHELEGLPQYELHTKGVWLSLEESAVNSLRLANYWLNDPNDYGGNWLEIRASILSRDRYRCQVCGAGMDSSDLHVHHKTPFRSFTEAESANHPSNLITLCPLCHRRVEQTVRMRSGLSGVAWLLANLAPLQLLCDRRDLGCFFEADSDLAGRKPIVAIYDLFPGGIGLSAKLYEIIEGVLKQSLEVINECGCERGCPSCVGPAGENGLGAKDYTREILKLMVF